MHEFSRTDGGKTKEVCAIDVSRLPKSPVSKTIAVQDVSLVTGTLSVLKVRKSETPMTSNREVQTVRL
jgi:hypothetical protein